MYDLIATAAAGIQAGTGLHAALTPISGACISYHARTRFLNLALGMTSCGCAIAAYKQEGRGDLWLVAAAGASLSIPYHLLLMNPPSSVLSGDAGSTLGVPTELPLPLEPHKNLQNIEEDRLLGHTSEPYPASGGTAPSSRGLMYARSGVLMTPEAAAGSWSRRYWFGAALSCASFAAMMSLLATRRESAAFVAPF